jgi:2-polyprenyl-3-methyl-5-hydroxy-6-metoxy-1,4-benzoquinol methylase
MVPPMAITHDPEGHEIAALEALVPILDGAEIVEIGCGDGRLTRRYSRRTRSVIALDPDEAAIARFRAGPPDARVDIRAIGIDRLELAHGSVDIVLLSWAL